MFIRSCWKPQSIDAAYRLVDDYPWALLVNSSADGPFATNLPLLLDRSRGGHGILLGHLARANDHARALVASPAPTLAIFHGPQSYVTASWYPHRQMPSTYYYTAVHCYGRVREQSARRARAHARDPQRPDGRPDPGRLAHGRDPALRDHPPAAPHRRLRDRDRALRGQVQARPGRTACATPWRSPTIWPPPSTRNI